VGRGASKVLSLRLQPFLKQFPVILTQSRQLVFEHIDRLFQPPTGYKLFIAMGDISGMYTNINSSITVNTIQAISERFATKNDADLNTELFSLINDRLPMRIQGKGGFPTFLEQGSGLAMGANHSPDIANLYCMLAQENWSSMHEQWLITYHRYIDDTFAVLWVRLAEEARAHLNLLKYPNLSSNWEVSDSSLVFLDMVMSIDDNHLDFCPYCKLNNQYQRLPADSAHPDYMKRAIVVGEAARLASICSR
jgi:hypothetical protein